MLQTAAGSAGEAAQRAHGLDCSDLCHCAEDSNVENIGSIMDKAARVSAAMTEDCWKGAGQAPGLEIWRVRNVRTESDTPDFGIERVPEEEYRQFFRGDSYILLYTYQQPDSDALLFNVHFWIGSESTADEYGVAAYKTVELDDLLGGVPIQYRFYHAHASTLTHWRYLSLSHTQTQKHTRKYKHARTRRWARARAHTHTHSTHAYTRIHNRPFTHCSARMLPHPTSITPYPRLHSGMKECESELDLRF